MSETSQQSQQKTSRDELLEILRTAQDPVLKSSEIATQTDAGQQTVSRRLQRMADDGLVRSKKVGRGYVWWVSGSVPERRLTAVENRVDELEDRLEAMESKDEKSGWLG